MEESKKLNEEQLEKVSGGYASDQSRYNVGDKVRFIWYGEEYTGTIYQVALHYSYDYWEYGIRCEGWTVNPVPEGRIRGYA